MTVVFWEMTEKPNKMVVLAGVVDGVAWVCTQLPKPS